MFQLNSGKFQRIGILLKRHCDLRSPLHPICCCSPSRPDSSALLKSIVNSACPWKRSITCSKVYVLVLSHHLIHDTISVILSSFARRAGGRLPSRRHALLPQLDRAGVLTCREFHEESLRTNCKLLRIPDVSSVSTFLVFFLTRTSPLGTLSTTQTFSNFTARASTISDSQSCS